MKATSRTIAMLACLLPVAGITAELSEVRSVPTLDLARYAGKWYEIAAFPMFFQRNCLGDTTAEYSLRADGEVTVDNRCRTESGTDRAVGRAWVPDGKDSARLKVSFFWPFRSDYWVIGLDEDYRWAVVGNPNRKYLWILSRSPQLPEPELARAQAAARAQGYDLGALRFTAQPAVVGR
jgi:apolipoprotein D and lipocalin family protein